MCRFRTSSRRRTCRMPRPSPRGCAGCSSTEMQMSEDAARDFVFSGRMGARGERARGDLYARHSRLLYGLILRILRDRAEAEEVLQEVFVLVWTRAETYNVALGSPAAWLVRISRNRAIDRLRANAVRLRAAEAAVEAASEADPA